METGLVLTTYLPVTDTQALRIGRMGLQVRGRTCNKLKMKAF
jgi:hypothetical protein